MLFEALGSFLMNIFSSYCYDKIKNKLTRKDRKKLNKEVSDWRKKFIESNKDEISKLEGFNFCLNSIELHKNIYDFIFNTGIKPLKEEEFINKQVNIWKDIIRVHKIDCSQEQLEFIKKYIKGLFGVYKEFRYDKLSLGEKLTRYEQRQLHNELSEDLSSQIEKLINNKNIDNQLAEELYFDLSKTIWEGKISEAYRILKIIKGKNNDLENAIKVKISIFGNYEDVKCNYISCLKEIKNKNIRDDLIRFLLYVDNKNSNLIEENIDLVCNKELKTFLGNVFKYKGELFDYIKNTNTDGIVHVDLRPKFELKNENWLASRLAVIEFKSKNLINIYSVIINLVKDKNIVDQLYVWHAFITQHININRNLNILNNEMGQLLAEIKSKIKVYENLAPFLRDWFYVLLIKVMYYTNDQNLEQILLKIQELKIDNDEILEIFILKNIKDHNISFNDVVSFAERTNKFYVVLYYLESIEKEEKISEFIDEYKYILKKEPCILDYYVSFIEKVKGQEEAKNLLLDYSAMYSNQLWFHIKRYHLDSKEENKNKIINEILANLNSYQISYEDIRNFIEILLKEKIFTKALDILSDIEKVFSTTDEILLMKIECLRNLEHHIELIKLISDNFSMLKKYNEAIILYLISCLSCRRKIDDRILNYAESVSDPRVLIICSSIELDNKNILLSKDLVIRSLFLNTQNDPIIFHDAFVNLTKLSDSNIVKIRYIQPDTYFKLENLRTKRLIEYCIHSNNNAIPTENFEWMHCIHITTSNDFYSVCMQVKKDEIIEHEGEQYKVILIEPLNYFFVRSCLEFLKKSDTSSIRFLDASTPEIMVSNLIKSMKNIPNDFRHDFFDSNLNFKKPHLYPIYSLTRIINKEYGEILRAFLMDNEYIKREITCHYDENPKKFLLTYYALSILFILEIDLSLIDKNIIFTPRSSLTLAEDEYKVIFQSYDKEQVSYLSLSSEKLHLYTASLDEKKKNISNALNFKKFVSEINLVDNFTDIDEPLFEGNLRNCIDISVYDSLAVCKNDSAFVLVDGESITYYLSNLPNLKRGTINVIDFLCYLNFPISKILESVSDLLFLKFTNIISFTCVDHIIRIFNGADLLERMFIINKWTNILRIPDYCFDYNLRKFFKDNLLVVLQFLSDKHYNFNHPIIYVLFTFYLHYNSFLIGQDSNSSLKFNFYKLKDPSLNTNQM